MRKQPYRAGSIITVPDSPCEPSAAVQKPGGIGRLGLVAYWAGVATSIDDSVFCAVRRSQRGCADHAVSSSGLGLVESLIGRDDECAFVPRPAGRVE